MKKLIHGVPHGNVLNPCNFSFFILPIDYTIRLWDIQYHISVDDTQLYISFDLKEHLLPLIHGWMDDQQHDNK